MSAMSGHGNVLWDAMRDYPTLAWRPMRAPTDTGSCTPVLIRISGGRVRPHGWTARRRGPPGLRRCLRVDRMRRRSGASRHADRVPDIIITPQEASGDGAARRADHAHLRVLRRLRRGLERCAAAPARDCRDARRCLPAGRHAHPVPFPPSVGPSTRASDPMKPHVTCSACCSWCGAAWRCSPRRCCSSRRGGDARSPIRSRPRSRQRCSWCSQVARARRLGQRGGPRRPPAAGRERPSWFVLPLRNRPRDLHVRSCQRRAGASSYRALH